MLTLKRYKVVFILAMLLLLAGGLWFIFLKQAADKVPTRGVFVLLSMLFRS